MAKGINQDKNPKNNSLYTKLFDIVILFIFKITVRDYFEAMISITFNPDYALELRSEKLKCNKSAIYIRKA